MELRDALVTEMYKGGTERNEPRGLGSGNAEKDDGGENCSLCSVVAAFLLFIARGCMR